MLLENGTYAATVKDISVYLRGDNERLTVAVKLDVNGVELVHRKWVEKNDGSISEKDIKDLKACFPKWDGSIETLDDTALVAGVEVSVVVENEPGMDDPSKMFTVAKWMNPAGSGTAKMSDRADRQTLANKYGAKFRALTGGAPAKAGPPKAPPPAPKPPVATSTQEEVWAELCKDMDGQARPVIEARWFTLTSAHGENWGAMLAEIRAGQLPG